MAKLCVENKSASIARTFFLGFCGNLVKFFYFSLNWSFLIGNATLKYYYLDFLESFHFCFYKLYIFQKTLNFFSRILIVLFICQITNQLRTNFENG